MPIIKSPLTSISCIDSIVSPKLIEVYQKTNLQLHNSLTTAQSSESASAFDDETSKLRPTAAAVRSKGSSISFVGEG